MKAASGRQGRRLIRLAAGAILAVALSGCSPQSESLGSFIVGTWDCVQTSSRSGAPMTDPPGYHIVVSSDGSIRSQMFDRPGHLINEVFNLHYKLIKNTFVLTWPGRTSTVITAEVPSEVRAGNPVKVAFVTGLTDQFSATTDGKSLAGLKWEGDRFKCDPSK